MAIARAASAAAKSPGVIGPSPAHPVPFPGVLRDMTMGTFRVNTEAALLLDFCCGRFAPVTNREWIRTACYARGTEVIDQGKKRRLVATADLLELV